MLPAFLFLALCTFSQTLAESEPVSWPLFEFWNPLTWLKPKFSSETMIQIFRSGKEPNRRMYQQLKKSLLPANLFFGNIRAQFAAWDNGMKKKPQKPKTSRRPSKKKSNKNTSNKNQ